jgi:hypothetical protein
MADRAALGVIEFGDTPAAVGEIRSYDAPSDANEIDVTVMGTGNAAFIPGAIRQALATELFFEFADAGQALALAQLGSSVAQTVSLYPLGVGTGLVWLTGKATVMSFNVQGAADGAIELSVNFSADSAGLVWAVQA